jgi:hypothetical protein
LKILGISGILIKPLGTLIACVWYKMAQLLNLVMSKVIMAVVFIFILVPLASLYRIAKKDSLRIKRSPRLKWITREHLYTAGDLKNLW